MRSRLMQRSEVFLRILSILGVLAAVTATRAAAQGDLEGRVLTNSGRTPVASADVRFPLLGRAGTTDSLGRFQLRNLPSGEQLVVIRLLGYRVDSVRVPIPEGQILVRDFVIQPVTSPIAEVRVTGAASRGKMSGFDDRRRQGIGRFIDREMLSKIENRSTSIILATVPGLAVMHGTGTRAWAYTTRSIITGRCAFCGSPSPCDQVDPADCQAGARAHCYMDVYLDGALVYMHDAPSPQPLFNVNSIPPEQVEGIELYSSASNIPTAYNRTGSGCGVMLIWTRISK